ncbi:hypothetical protein [Ramlibacter rhizophilus]|uniref:hypothetical protein n=1 Tax=Ramlibacter rhizophilus TaxID=1781167 RepID=UPI00143260BC|nr:hypothetical protein [Ramlibacter rhizophilus]
MPRSALAAPWIEGRPAARGEPLRLSRTIRVFWRADVHRTPLMDEFVLAMKERYVRGRQARR